MGMVQDTAIFLFNATDVDCGDTLDKQECRVMILTSSASATRRSPSTASARSIGEPPKEPMLQ